MAKLGRAQEPWQGEDNLFLLKEWAQKDSSTVKISALEGPLKHMFF